MRMVWATKASHNEERYALLMVSRQLPPVTFERRLGVGPVTVFLATAAFFSTWTGVRIAGLNISDFALTAAALLCLLEAALNRRKMVLELWMILPGFASIMILGVNVIAMQMPLFTSAVVSDSLVGNAALSESGGGALFVLRLVIATTFVAFAVKSEILTQGRAAALLILRWFALGASASALVAALTFSNLLSNDLPTYHILTSRAVGLAFHPNSLALASVLALPVTYWMAKKTVSAGGVRLFWSLASVVLLVAIYAADSRSALIVGGIELAVLVGLSAHERGGRAWLFPVGILVVLFALLSAPTLLGNTRLFDLEGNAQESSEARNQLLTLALQQFQGSPVFGVGLGRGSGVMVPALVVSSGGIVLLIGLYYFLLKPWFQMVARKADNLVLHCLISSTSLIVMGFATNSVSERFDYWTLCVGAALVALPRTDTVLSKHNSRRTAGVHPWND
jgi:hypothetical protein